MSDQYFSQSVAETEAIGEALGKSLPESAIVLYYGGLGMGKTAMTRGIGKGLGIDSPVTSPTFTLVQEYEGGELPLYHFDLYRLGENVSEDALYELGFDEYFYDKGVCVVEWAELLSESFWQELGEEFPLYQVEFSQGKGEEEREIVIKKPSS
ncbi:MAG: tRNA (adenosine(37)-N6)-threonylcarbamoyltransferase complex ATPase subunit type 1 TsaE [Eubacteriales bacterium]